MMYWNHMEYGVPDFHKPCIIKLKRGKDCYSVASFEIWDRDEGIWCTRYGIHHNIEVSHWAYITPPNN